MRLPPGCVDACCPVRPGLTHPAALSPSLLVVPLRWEAGRPAPEASCSDDGLGSPLFLGAVAVLVVGPSALLTGLVLWPLGAWWSAVIDRRAERRWRQEMAVWVATQDVRWKASSGVPEPLSDFWEALVRAHIPASPS